MKGKGGGGRVFSFMFLSHCTPGTALREAGGTSFEQAVKEVADKQSLSVGEGKPATAAVGGVTST